ncbi:secreted RxLR effector protein 161-like [Belonocnema kinseyi]|uniref:secreted RxLR effector protein 161-like n=1 Tax=Belonocnema kinseyi TaxID=2817044 RepID=UPI00143DAF03|nr:secreted RxLR effector protein 161-like [Belonocnema kinseyi]
MYIDKILSKFRLNETNPISVTVDLNAILRPAEEVNESRENVPFREAVGSLIFLATVSWPEIPFSANVLSRLLSNHDDSHWQAVKRIFKYFVGIADFGIKYSEGGHEPQLIGYSDADYASDLDTQRSVIGYAFSLANGLVSWSIQRQNLVTLSTAKSEYVGRMA